MLFPMKCDFAGIVSRITLADIALRLLLMNGIQVGVAFPGDVVDHRTDFKPGAFRGAGDILLRAQRRFEIADDGRRRPLLCIGLLCA